MKVLVIEDNYDISALIRRFLETSGHEVLEAHNGEAGLRTFEESSPDLVITDIIMPDRDGLEIIQEVRKQKPRTKIIAMSGGGKYLTMDFLTVAQRLGADRSLQKPIDFELLVDTVNELAQSRSIEPS